MLQDDGDHYCQFVHFESRQTRDLDRDPLHRVVLGRDESRWPPLRDTTRTGDAEPCGRDAELGLDAPDSDTVPHSAYVSNQAIAGLPEWVVHRHTIHETDRQPEIDAWPGRACKAP
jgi:hypothetical protein